MAGRKSASHKINLAICPMEDYKSKNLNDGEPANLLYIRIKQLAPSQ